MQKVNTKWTECGHLPGYEQRYNENGYLETRPIDVSVGAISEVHGSSNYGNQPLIGWRDLFECEICGALVRDINLPMHQVWHSKVT